jgi:putative thioredoxin
VTVDVTTSSFDDLVVHRSYALPVVVDFWAEWCGPCRALAPALEKEIAERAGAVELAKVDVDANPELSQRFGVSGIPAVKGFREGRVVAEFVGALSPTAISAWLDGLLAPPRADTLVAELRANGELPEVVALLDHGDSEGALAYIVAAVAEASPELRDRLREVAVALFDRLGPDDPLVATYRRRLSAALY